MVSIIVPCYNQEAYLADTLDSILEQSYQHWECLMIDDGSTDHTGQIALEYCKRDKRFKYFYQENAGVSAARNTAFQHIQGNYVQFLDGDDMIQPEKLRSQVEYLEAHTDVQIVISDFIEVSSKAEMHRKHGLTPNEYRKSMDGKIMSSILVHGNYIRINAPLARRSVYINPVFDPSLKAIEDWDLWIRLALENGHFHFLDTANGHAVIRTSSIGLSSDLEGMQKHYIPVLQKVFFHPKAQMKVRFFALLRASFMCLDRLFRGKKIRLYPNNKIAFASLLVIGSTLFLPLFAINKLRLLLKS